jgi:CheY-like chemotaxis protein
MGERRNRLFIAAPAAVIRHLGGLFAAHEVEIVGCETWDDAVSRLEEKEADLLVICYAFDEMRPFRLLQYLRQERPRAHLPTILVRALPVPLGKTQEEQIRSPTRTSASISSTTCTTRSSAKATNSRSGISASPCSPGYRGRPNSSGKRQIARVRAASSALSPAAPRPILLNRS